MRDEDYEPQQIADYGARAQPAVAENLRPQLTSTLVGVVAAGLAVAVSLGAVVTFPDFTGLASGRGWAVVALVVAVVLLAISATQHLIWRRAMRVWTSADQLTSTQQPGSLQMLTRVSWLMHLVSYAVVLLGLWTCTAGSIAAGTTSRAAVLLALAVAFMLAAQVLAGAQYLRVSGPSGTIPGHLRRLSAGIHRRR